MTNKRLKLTQLTHDQVQARIIDPEGKIFKTLVGEDPSFYKLLDELFK